MNHVPILKNDPSSPSIALEESSKRLIFYSDLHRSTVTIFVSPEHYPFHLHKGRLCQHSHFFERAFHDSSE